MGATNRSVLLRYSSSPCNATDENEDYRRRLKQESELITLNKGKPSGKEPAGSYDSSKEFDEQSKLIRDKESLLLHKNSDLSLSKGTMVNIGESVDSMLQNI